VLTMPDCDSNIQKVNNAALYYLVACMYYFNGYF
jgi:hypothetical protein